MKKKILYTFFAFIMISAICFWGRYFFYAAGVPVTEKRMLVIRDSLQSFYVDEGCFPVAEKGLGILVEKKYLKEKELLDFWGRKFQYLVSDNFPFVLISFGKDGKPGGKGFEKDITSIEVFEKERACKVNKFFKERNKMTETLPGVVETCDLLFQRIYEKKGYIQEFNWKNNLLTIVVEHCYPDEIVFDRACAVSSKTGRAEFKADLKVADNFDSIFGEKDGALNAMNYQMILRNSLSFCGALIQAESIWQNKSEIRFFTSPQNLGRCLQCCYNCTSSSLWHESAVSIQKCGSGFIVEMDFEQGIKSEFSILYLLSSYSSIFSLDDTIPLNLETVKRQNYAGNFERQYVGRMEKGNGTLNNFFRYPEGSIPGESYDQK